MIGLPSSWPILGALVAGAGIAGAAAGWKANSWRHEAKLQELRATHSALVADAERRTSEAEAAERAKEQRRIEAQQEVSRVTSIARTRDQADRRAADIQHQRMLDAATAAAVSAGRACRDPSAAAGSPAASESVRALADVLGEADRFAGEMAAAADSYRTAGLACVSAYESLSE